MIITLLRKPLEGSVADNTLKHGCGAINIDATRVGTEARTYKGMGNKVGNEENASGSSIYWMSKPPTTKSMREGASGDVVYEVEGRWPANFILTHLEGCELRGTKKIKEGKVNKDKGGSLRESGLYEDGLKTTARNHFRGEEEIKDWVCVEGCPVKEIDLQSGSLKSTTRKPTGNPIYPTSNTSVTWNANNVMDTTQRGFNDEGGASRFFKQFKGDQ